MRMHHAWSVSRLRFFLLFFDFCSSLGTAFDTGVLGGSSVLKDKSRISLNSVGFSESGTF